MRTTMKTHSLFGNGESLWYLHVGLHFRSQTVVIVKPEAQGLKNKQTEIGEGFNQALPLISTDVVWN